jgi:hypothetical protein
MGRFSALLAEWTGRVPPAPETAPRSAVVGAWGEAARPRF